MHATAAPQLEQTVTSTYFTVLVLAFKANEFQRSQKTKQKGMGKNVQQYSSCCKVRSSQFQQASKMVHKTLACDHLVLSTPCQHYQTKYKG